MILLIDLSGIYWANWHATKDLEVSEAYERTVSKVNALRAGFKHVAICCDAPPYFRKEILPTYKAQRESPPPQAVEQLERAKARLKADGLLIWESRGFEADDVIATFAADWLTAGAAMPRERLVIASSDKDLLTLVNDAAHISVLSPLTGKTYDAQAVIEKFGVSPDMLGDLLALMGDASDNVPGVPSVGPKTGAKLLHEWGSLEGVLTHGDDIPGAVGQKIKEHGPAARLARKVVTLRTDAPIKVEDIFVEREPAKLETREYEVSEPEPEPAQPDPGKKEDALARPGPTTAISVPVQFEHGLEPSSMGAAWQLAKGVFQSRLYPQLATPEAVWAIIIRGREMGLGALTALDTIVMIQGKPALSAHLMIARAKQHPECEYFQLVSSDETAAEYVTKRKGNPEPTRMRYTIEQAKLAGLAGRGNWLTRPAELLRKTAGVHLARAEYPEALLGAYAQEELE